MLRLFTTIATLLIFVGITNSQLGDKLKLLSLQEYKYDLVKFAHRTLKPEEVEIYETLLKQVIDPENLKLGNYRKRYDPLEILSQSPHVMLIKPLAEFIRQLQPHHEMPWNRHILGQKEIKILSRCADEEVIDLLIEFLGHPLRGVRGQALEELQKILKLPKEYSFGKLSWVHLEDIKKRKKVVEFLRKWWKENKGKISINWNRILEEY